MGDSSNKSTDLAKRIKDENCTPEELSALVGISSMNDRLIAVHKNTGSEALEKLSSSKDALTREFVTGNANTPLKILLQLADDFPRAFLLNPAFEMLALEDPGALERLYEPTLARILAQKECPASIVNWAFKHYSRKSTFNSQIMLGIVQNPAVPVKIINSILKLNVEVDLTCQECLL